MSLSQKSIQNLGAFFIEFTHRPGVLRKIQLKDDLKSAQGVHFTCPVCPNNHGITLLFDLPSVPPHASPKGRYTPSYFPCVLTDLTLGEAKSPYCEWKGSVIDGEVIWEK